MLPLIAAASLLLAGIVTRSAELTWTGAATFVALVTAALVMRDHANASNTNTRAM